MATASERIQHHCKSTPLNFRTTSTQDFDLPIRSAAVPAPAADSFARQEADVSAEEEAHTWGPAPEEGMLVVAALVAKREPGAVPQVCDPSIHTVLRWLSCCVCA